MRQATLKLNNNRAAGLYRISAEFVKYTSVEVYVFFLELLNLVLENHQMLNIGRGSLCLLYKSRKPKGPVKNLRLVILLTILRKIISTILLKRVKRKYEDYISQSQSAYISNRNISDVVWAHR